MMKSVKNAKQIFRFVLLFAMKCCYSKQCDSVTRHGLFYLTCSCSPNSKSIEFEHYDMLNVYNLTIQECNRLIFPSNFSIHFHSLQFLQISFVQDLILLPLNSQMTMPHIYQITLRHVKIEHLHSKWIASLSFIKIVTMLHTEVTQINTDAFSMSTNSLPVLSLANCTIHTLEANSFGLGNGRFESITIMSTKIDNIQPSAIDIKSTQKFIIHSTVIQNDIPEQAIRINKCDNFYAIKNIFLQTIHTKAFQIRFEKRLVMHSNAFRSKIKAYGLTLISPIYNYKLTNKSPEISVRNNVFWNLEDHSLHMQLGNRLLTVKVQSNVFPQCNSILKWAERQAKFYEFERNMKVFVSKLIKTGLCLNENYIIQNLNDNAKTLDFNGIAYEQEQTFKTSMSTLTALHHENTNIYTVITPQITETVLHEEMSKKKKTFYNNKQEHFWQTNPINQQLLEHKSQAKKSKYCNEEKMWIPSKWTEDINGQQQLDKSKQIFLPLRQKNITHYQREKEMKVGITNGSKHFSRFPDERMMTNESFYIPQIKNSAAKSMVNLNIVKFPFHSTTSKKLMNLNATDFVYIPSNQMCHPFCQCVKNKIVCNCNDKQVLKLSNLNLKISTEYLRISNCYSLHADILVKGFSNLHTIIFSNVANLILTAYFMRGKNNIKYFMVNNSSIKKVPRGCFAHIQKVDSIKMIYVNISSIDSGAFRISNIEKFQITNSMITTIQFQAIDLDSAVTFQIENTTLNFENEALRITWIDNFTLYQSNLEKGIVEMAVKINIVNIFLLNGNNIGMVHKNAFNFERARIVFVTGNLFSGILKSHAFNSMTIHRLFFINNIVQRAENFSLNFHSLYVFANRNHLAVCHCPWFPYTLSHKEILNNVSCQALYPNQIDEINCQSTYGSRM